MREEKNPARASLILFVACWLVYAVLCLTKNAFGSAIAPIVQEGFMTKSQSGIVNGAYYVTYGGAQLLLARLVDKVSPTKMLHISLFAAFFSMAGFMVATSYSVILILWAVTGLLQFACWPATIRIISQYMIPEMRGKAMISIAFCYCFGTMVNSLSASVILKFMGWRYIFGFSMVVVLLVWLIFWCLSGKTIGVLEKAVVGHHEMAEAHKKKEGHKKSTKNIKIMFLSGIMIMMIPGFIRAALDTGLKAWVPTLIMEKYGVSSSFASLLTTVVMFVNLTGVFIANWIYPKLVKNEVMGMVILFAVSVPCLILLTRIGAFSVWIAVILLTLVTTFMYGGNQIINIKMPARFAALNLSGGIASTLNGSACMGIVAANMGFGYLADRFDWGVTIWIWVALAAIGGITSFLAVHRWVRFTTKKKKA